MAEGSNTEKFTKTPERSNGPYIRAVLNPDTLKFQELLMNSSHSILDIGCGSPPRLSWKLSSQGKGDLWVGCDPGISEAGASILVHKGYLPIGTNVNLTVFSKAVEEIPAFTPDAMVIVAPNPQDIVEGQIFNDDLKRFLDPNKKQHVIVGLDNRTVEALGYASEAGKIIRDWMRENGFARVQDSSILDKYSPNSDDLESGNVPMCFLRDKNFGHGRTI